MFVEEDPLGGLKWGICTRRGKDTTHALESDRMSKKKFSKKEDSSEASLKKPA